MWCKSNDAVEDFGAVYLELGDILTQIRSLIKSGDGLLLKSFVVKCTWLFMGVLDPERELAETGRGFFSLHLSPPPVSRMVDIGRLAVVLTFYFRVGYVWELWKSFWELRMITRYLYFEVFVYMGGVFSLFLFYLIPLGERLIVS